MPTVVICTLMLLSGARCGAADVQITAGYIEYDESAKYLLAIGSVAVTWGDKTLNGDRVSIWVEKKYAEAEGSVVFAEEGAVLSADRLAYDYTADSATIMRASGYAAPQHFAARVLTRVSSTTYAAQHVAMTTCDLGKPHYTLRARRAKITLNKRVVLYHPVFYLRNVPILYLPLFTSALGAHRSSLEIIPGYNNQDGLTIKAIYGYPLTSNLYGKLYLDWLGRRGWGKGGELTYSTATARGTVYAYHLDERRDGHESLALRSEFWQRLNPLWYVQGEMDYVSDKSVNDSRYLEDRRVDMRIHSFGAVTRQGRISNLRVVGESYDVYDSSAGTFTTETLTVPAISYTLYPQKWGMPFYTGFSASLQNRYSRYTGYYTMSGSADLSVTRDIRLTRRLTYKPQVGARESWVNRASDGALEDTFLTTYYANNNLRVRLLRWMDWDLSHAFAWKSVVNSLLLDPDGETTNSVNYINSMSFGKLRVKDSIGYNFHLYRTQTVADWRDALTPLVNEAYWSPRQNVSVFGRQENTIYPFRLTSVQMDTRFGQADVRYINIGAFYHYTRPDDMTFTTGLGFWPTKKWKIDCAVNWASQDHFTSMSFNDHELKIYRDLHCWEAKLGYRRRPDGNEDIQLQIGLKRSSRARAANSAYAAREFYPWRE